MGSVALVLVTMNSYLYSFFHTVLFFLTRFLQVSENWKKSENLCDRGKVRENDLGSCILQISVICFHFQILTSRQTCGFY